MSLLITGIQRVKAFVLMLLAVTLAASMSLLGVPSAFADATDQSTFDGVTVTPGEPDCGYLYRTVTNSTDKWVTMKTFEVFNGVRLDQFPMQLGPGESIRLSTNGMHYFSHSFGISTGVWPTDAAASSGMQWKDWGATEYVLPPGCPPMLAPAKVLGKAKIVTKAAKPIIRFRSSAYYTDFGYQVVGKGKRIKWTARWLHAGKNGAYGPRLKPGQRVKLKFYSRNHDDGDKVSAPVYVGTKKVKRVRR